MNNDGKNSRQLVLNINGEEITYVFAADYHYANSDGCHTITFREDREQFEEAVPCENGHLFYDRNGIPKFFVSDSDEVFKLEGIDE